MKRRIALILVLSVLGGMTLRARVFFRWGGGDQQPLSTEQTSWPLAAEKQVSIDGRSATVQVFASPVSGRQALERFRSLYENKNAAVAVFPELEIGWGLAVWPDRVTKALVISPRALTHSLLFLVHTDDAPVHPVVPALPDVPDYPGARIGSTVRSEEQGAASRFLFTSAGATEILAWYDTALGQAGWSPIFTDASGLRANAPLAVYTRGARVCMVSVSDAASAVAERIVTLLVTQSGGS